MSEPRLRVAVVTDAIYPYHMGGKEMRYRHVVEGLAALGLDVHVYTMNWWNGPATRVERGVTYHALCRRYDLYNGTRRSFVEAIMFSVGCLRLFGQRFDVIEADHMPHLQLFPVRLVAALRRVPLVVTWHEVWGRDYWREYLGRLGVVAAWIEARTMRLADVLVTPSPETAARLEHEGIPPARVAVVPNGIDFEEIASTPPAAEHHDVLYVGRLIAHKHVDDLLRAVAELAGRGHPVTCAILGAGPQREVLDGLVAELGLAGRVAFLGGVDDPSGVFAAMKAAKVLALPSTREGFGIVVAEALACGTPVVTTRHPDNHAQALVEEGVNGWLCEPTPHALADALDVALAGPPAAATLPPSRREELSWAPGVERIAGILRAAIGTNRDRRR